MARLSLIVCDFCNRVSKDELSCTLALQRGKGKDKEVVKAEICSKCYDNIAAKIDSDFDVNSFSQPGQISIQPQAPKIIADGETIVPSSAENVTALPSQNTSACQHDRSSFEPPGKMKCRDCGEEWAA